MGDTMDEGSEFIEKSGYTGKPGETRSQKQLRETVDIILSPDKRDITQLSPDELGKYRAQLLMMFRLFNEKKNGKLVESEMESIFKAMGKNKTKSKVTKIFKQIDNSNVGYITSDQFITYIIEKRKLKATKSGDSKTKEKSDSLTDKKANKKEDKKANKKEDKKEDKKEEKKETKSETRRSSRIAKADEEKKEQQKKKEEKSTEKEVSLQKGLSIADFYTSYAGLHDEFVPETVDAHHNPVGREYDLGIEGAFSEFSIILLYLYTVNFKKLEDALKSKGFKVTITSSIDDYVEKLHEHDEAWFICSGSPIHNAAQMKGVPKLVEELVKFHDAGKGIFVWADNSPFYYEANLLFEKILPTVALIGNTKGDNILQPQSVTATSEQPLKGHFARHLITTGIVSLYEGITICYPDKILPNMTVIGQSTDNHPCFFCTEEPGKGRLLVDCGFTKLYDQKWDKTAGTERYVLNCSVWLLGLEARIKMGAPMKGDIRAMEANTTTTSSSS